MMHLFTFLTVILSVVLLTLAKVECPTNDGEDAVYLPHETECGKFYECAARTPVLLECPAGTYFDVRVNTCSSDVDCGNLATSTEQPPTTPTEPTAPATTPTEPPTTPSALPPSTTEEESF